MEAVLASLAWWLTLIISAKASSHFSWQKSTAADQRDLVFIKEEEEFLWAKSGTISLLFAKLLMCHVRMESSTGLVTETNGVLDLAKVNMQKKPPKKQWLSTPACHIWGSAVFPSTPISLNLDLDLMWRYFFFFLFCSWLWHLTSIFYSQWNGKIIVFAALTRRRVTRIERTAQPDSIIMHIRSCGQKTKQTARYAPHYGADHVQYIYERIFLLQLSPSCKINTALRDELSYRLKRWMNIQRSCW